MAAKPKHTATGGAAVDFAQRQGHGEILYPFHRGKTGGTEPYSYGEHTGYAYGNGKAEIGIVPRKIRQNFSKKRFVSIQSPDSL